MLGLVVGLDAGRVLLVVRGRGQEGVGEGERDQSREGQDEEGEELALRKVSVAVAREGGMWDWNTDILVV